MALRNSKGDVVSAAAYKKETMSLLEVRLERAIRAATSETTAPPRGTAIAVELLRTDELASVLFSAVPVSEPRNRLAELVGPCFDTVGAAAVLGRHRGRPISKQAMEARRKRRSILALRTSDERWVYPTFQFQDGDVRADVASLFPVFADHSAWSMAAWFQRPAYDLRDLSPLAWLDAGHEPQPVSMLARREAARWATR